MPSNPKKTLLILCLPLILLMVVKSFWWLLLPIVLLVFVAFFLPKMAFLIEQLWHKLARTLGIISSTILLSTIYFLILSPLAFFYRKKNKHTSFLFDRKKTSNFIEIKDKPDLDFNKTW